MLTRKAKLLSCINPYVTKGAEIGALDRPIVTNDIGFIKYIDYTNTEELKSIYEHRNTEKMVEVDYIWGDSSLDLLLNDDMPLDYIIASHVLEHVPDLIGWLQEVHKVLKPGGFLSLALPAKTQCFDYYRNDTVTSDIIDAYIRGARKPSPKAIFDHRSLAVRKNGKPSWAGQVNEAELKKMYSMSSALETAEEAYKNDIYQDAHCWTFSLKSLKNLFQDLIEMELFTFKVAAFYAIRHSEFFMTLESVELSNLSTLRKEQLRSLKLIK